MTDPHANPSSPNGPGCTPVHGAVSVGVDATGSTAGAVPSPCFRLAVSGGVGAEPPQSAAGAATPTSLDTTESTVNSEMTSNQHPLKSGDEIRREFDQWWAERRVTRVELGNSNAVAVAGDVCPELDENSCAAKFRHNSWRVNRRRVWESMGRTSQTASRRRAFGGCGCHSWIEQSATTPGIFRVRCDHCNDRLCVPCGVKRSAKVQRALASACRGKRLTFITLTLCGRGEPLAEMLDRLYKHFRALRLLPIWEKVEGGAAFLEVKYSDKAKRWHPHLHLICEAGWIDQGCLSDCWRMLTKDSYIVDVRRVADEDAAFRYVTKYASKPLSPTFLASKVLIDEAIVALKGRRLIFCFGEWYGTPLDSVEDDELDTEQDDPAWRYFAPLEQILSDATCGSRDAQQILKALNVEGLWRASLDSS